MDGKTNGAEHKPDHQVSLPEARKRLGERAKEILGLEAQVTELSANLEASQKAAAGAVAGGEATARRIIELELEVEQLKQVLEIGGRENARLKSVAAEHMRHAEENAEIAEAHRPRTEEAFELPTFLFALRPGQTDWRVKGSCEKEYVEDEAALEALQLKAKAEGRTWKPSRRLL